MDRLNIKRFCIENWLVEPELNQISRDGSLIKLEPKTMDVLVYLVRHPNTVISREELLDVVWADSFVAENTLSRTISRLRKALGDDWQQPRFLETISKTGYRWICPVQTLPVGEPLMTVPETEAIPAPPESKLKSQGNSAGYITALLAASLVGALWLWWPQPPPSSPEAIAEVRPAVTLVGRQANPVLSPDGRHIAFGWQGAEGQNWDIYVQSVDADNPRRLTEDPGLEVLPAWSPDSRFLAFIAGPDSCGIYRVPLTGGPRVKMAECLENPRHLDWSPDGLRLAFDGRTPGSTTQAIFVVSAEGRPAERVLEPAQGSQGDWYPVFSPDGGKLAFLRKQTADLYHIFVHDLNNGNTRQITQHQVGRIRGLDWTAAGDGLVYSYNRDGRYALWRVALAGGPPRRLPITDAWVTYPSLARQGKALIYKNYADVIDLWSLTLDSEGVAVGEPRRKVPSTRSELHPRLSPVDGRLAFLSNRTGAFEVWSGSGDQLIRHSDLEGLVPGLVAWDPTGSRLVFDAREEGQSDLFLVDADSRTPRVISQTPHNEANPCFSADGAVVYFGSDQSGDWQIWATDLAGGNQRQVTRSGGYFLQVDPNGQSLWFTRLNEPGIFQLELATGKETEIWQGLGPNDWGNWHLGPSGIFFLDRATNSLMLKPFDGEPRVVFRAPRTFPYLGPAFHISRDQRRLVFGQIAQSDDEIMIADYLPAD